MNTRKSFERETKYAAVHRAAEIRTAHDAMTSQICSDYEELRRSLEERLSIMDSAATALFNGSETSGLDSDQVYF